MFGWLLQWPTIPTLLMFPVLAWVYARLAAAEEGEVAQLFPGRWADYAASVHAYVPHRPVAAAQDEHRGSRGAAMPTAEHLTAEARASSADGQVLRADGVVKAFRRGLWPRRRSVPVLRGAGLRLHAGEVVGLSARTVRARAHSCRSSSDCSLPTAGPSSGPVGWATARSSRSCTHV